MDATIERIGRREWWLWLAAAAVTALSAITFALSAFPSLFGHRDHFYEIGVSQARWGTLSLLLLFNVWLVYRQWTFRRARKHAAGQANGLQGVSDAASDPFETDQVTRLYTRASVEHWLGREVARARRQHIPLSLLALHLDDFAELEQRFGSAAGDQMLREFADRLRRASRGCDFGARLASDGLVLVLPECSVSDAKIVSDRIGSVEVKCAGQDIALTYSIGVIDYKPGEVPSELLKRAEDMLQLYAKASKVEASATLVIR